MKIVCDACQAKYSISDDKVQGKVFKIRCKKCSNIIVVRGGSAVEPAQPPPQEKDTRVYDYGYDGGDHAPAGDEAVWHVVINQDQVGPMTAVEVQRRFKSGELDAETYIWREGFADWLPMAQVDTFASLLAAGPPAARSSGSEAVASMFAGGEDASAARSDPGDLFAAASASAAQQDDDGGDLFGGKPAASPVQPAGTRMRGERNENSVLFSLNNLAQLASDKPAPAPAPRSAMAVGSTPGAAGGEGSGLIDIRSMASAYLGAPAGAPKPATAGIGSIDDLPVFGGGGFTEPAVIVPIAARSSNNKLLYTLIGSVGLLAVAAVVVVILLLTGSKSSDKPAQVAQASGTEVKPAADTRAAATPSETDTRAGTSAGSPPSTGTTSAGSAAPSSGTGEARPTKVAAAEAEPKHTQATAPVHKASPASTASTPPKAVAKTPDKPAATPPKETPVKAEKPDKSDSGGCDEVSCVLNSYEGACCAKFRKSGGKAPAPSSGGAPPAGPKSDVPESLDRTMISDGVAKVKARAMACGDKSPTKGQVKVSVKVSPDGHVVNVAVKNSPDPGLGNCVAGVMQQAKFARTQSGGSFSYPFQF
ncbi:MAG: DUF4339 domain-containing protein [Deltaproteobacteria bacterium]|nr:MAG: DUF4339 domain-containing protein [Deltaproteobacteria bacterium]